MKRSILGTFETRKTCDTCHGTGKVPTEKCTECHGKGVRNKQEEITVNIPAGINAGEMVRMTGMGEAVQGGQAGDLYIKINVKSHVTFKRDGLNLTLDLPIKLTDALLGKVGRNLKISAENATLLGAVGGTLMVNAESLHTGTDVKGASTLHAKTITLEKTAAFGSPVSYWREGGNMDFGGALRNGATATYDESAAAVGKDTSKMGAAAFLGVFSVYSLLSGMLIIGLLLLITRTFFSDLAKQLKTEPGWSLLYGLMYLVLVPAIAFMAKKKTFNY
jgi:hypothetical protein